jgi:ribonuclease HI
MANLENTLVIYTDGACSGNPGPAGLGVFLQYGSKKKFISEYIGTGTNNIAELTALLRAMESIKKPSLPIVIYTDSSYSIGVLTKGWKAKKNTELIASIKSEMRRFENLVLKKVKGHSGIEGNEIADDLATRAVETKSSTISNTQ